MSQIEVYLNLIKVKVKMVKQTLNEKYFLMKRSIKDFEIIPYNFICSVRREKRLLLKFKEMKYAKMSN